MAKVVKIWFHGTFDFHGKKINTKPPPPNRKLRKTFGNPNFKQITQPLLFQVSKFFNFQKDYANYDFAHQCFKNCWIPPFRYNNSQWRKCFVWTKNAHSFWSTRKRILCSFFAVCMFSFFRFYYLFCWFGTIQK